MEVRDLRLVLAIEENGNLTLASRQLFVSQSALSHHLKDLEERLGVSLFRRADRKMETTLAGQRIVTDAKKILADLARLSHSVKREPKGETSLLRITTDCYTCYGWLPQLLGPFTASSPHVSVRIVPEATRNPINALVKRIVDMSIVPQGIVPDGVEQVSLFEDEIGLVVPRSHRFARRRFVQAGDLASAHLFFYGEPRESYIFRKFLAPAGVEPQSSEVPLTEAMVEMVRGNLGFAFMARWAIASLSTRKNLAFVRLTKHGFFRQWCAAIRKQDADKTYMDDFIALLQQAGKKL